MAEKVTIARPYAEAVFRMARDTNRLNEWSDMLEFIGAVVAAPQMQELIGNPRVPAGDLERLFISISGERIDAAARNFVHVLIDNDRLDLLPQIRELFEGLRAEQENVLEARVTSAYPISDVELTSLVKKLEQRFKRQVVPTVHLEPELIGGVRVEVGDDVLDASVRGKLQELAYALTR